MESFTYAYLPEEVQTVSIALFRDVRNAAALRSRLVFAANMPGEEGVVERDALNFAFIDAKPVRF
jgi:EKC/KEOPS complex subunit CGI121/TPRKB